MMERERTTRTYLRAALRDEWDGLERITRDLRPADFATLANALAGLAAILALFVLGTQWAVALILVGILLDGVDGAVARLGYGNGPLGASLDSLADSITFVAAPAVMVAFLAANGPVQSYLLAAAAFFGFCGLLRLARFEAMREKRRRTYFSGLSAPAAALVLSGLTLVGTLPAWTLAAAAIVCSILMVSRIRYPKLRGPLGAVAAVTILVVLVAITMDAAWLQAANLGMLAFLAIFVLVGPFYVLARSGPVREAHSG